jgi:hypothetical protein
MRERLRHIGGSYGPTQAQKLLLSIVLLSAVSGCHDPSEKFGKTYYLDGAGNWGFGIADVPAGLKAAGYKGHVEVYLWTSSFNPAVDQINIANNRLRAAILATKIDDYLNRHPGNDVNLIALSAGTGIATWAVENISGNHKIANLVLLGSSLSYNYDMSKALSHIAGKVYVYYSPHDEVLTTGARALGTVDRKFVDGAGLRGLHPSTGGSQKIVNIPWSSRYNSLGWTGAHTDATSRAFVQHVIAPEILSRRPTERVTTAFSAGDTSARLAAGSSLHATSADREN